MLSGLRDDPEKVILFSQLVHINIEIADGKGKPYRVRHTDKLTQLILGKSVLARRHSSSRDRAFLHTQSHASKTFSVIHRLKGKLYDFFVTMQ